MARELEITRAYESGLYDLDTGADCKTEKVVDITEDCPGVSSQGGCVLLYARAGRRRIVQIARPKGEPCQRIHFFVDELEHEMCVAPRDDIFGSWASQLGLSKSALHSLVKTHAPVA